MGKGASEFQNELATELGQQRYADPYYPQREMDKTGRA
jgi:hypothetical protein